MEIYKEIKIYPSHHYRISVENFRYDIGDKGFTIKTSDINQKGDPENSQFVCFGEREAIEVMKAIQEIVNGISE